ncbi:hypothetical protein EDB19DRAFT_293756 [Suillus lakei]|nr:hypothetical protein EDB19DRAFT_293756 [Suillus lakei]
MEARSPRASETTLSAACRTRGGLVGPIQRISALMSIEKVYLKLILIYMTTSFGNWAVQRCLEAAATPEERRKIVNCMRGRVVDLATNCYGCHVLQKTRDCEEDIRLLIISELLLGDPALTLVNKHASHV